MPRLIAYSYVHEGAEDHGSTMPMFNATATLGIIEQTSSPTVTYVRPTLPQRLYDPSGGADDQLGDWGSALNSYTPAGLYEITYSATTRRVTIASTNSTSFRPKMVEDLALWLGFSQDLSSGWATSWTADDAPAGVAELLGATVEPAEDGARVDLKEYRQGRAVSVVWGNHQLHKATIYFDSTTRDQIESGYLTTGRVQFQQLDSVTDVYAADTLGGVLEGFVVAAGDPTEDCDIGGLWSLNLLLAVAR